MKLALMTVRMVATWLADATNGVNAELANVDYDGTDVQPSNVTVYNDTDHGWVTRRKMLDEAHIGWSTPSVWVMQHAAFALQPGVNQGKHNADAFQLGIAVIDDAETTEDGLRDVWYRMEAVVRSIRTLMFGNETNRTRENVQIQKVNSWTFEQPMVAKDDRRIIQPLILELMVRETNP